MSYLKYIFSPLVVDTAAVSGPPVTINGLTVTAVIIKIRLCLDMRPAVLSDALRALYWGNP